jgi:hypothetical protein
MIDLRAMVKEISDKLPRFRLTPEEKEILERGNQFALGGTIPIRGSEGETVIYGFARGICPDCSGNDFRETLMPDQVSHWQCHADGCGAKFVVTMVQGYKTIDRRHGAAR